MSGTRHGDWWSLHGIQFFVLAGLASLLAKHLIRPTGRAFAQYVWWGPNRIGVGLVYGVILVGAVWILALWDDPDGLVVPGMFAVLIGALALSGRSFIAIWHQGPISGMSYWATIALSPELLVSSSS